MLIPVECIHMGKFALNSTLFGLKFLLKIPGLPTHAMVHYTLAGLHFGSARWHSEGEGT